MSSNFNHLSEYVIALKKGDRSCFEDFYNLTKKRVYFTAYALLKDKGLSEDVMQEVYISFLNGIANIDAKQNVYAYLTISARNKSLNLIKRAKRETPDEERLTREPVTDQYKDGGLESLLSLIDDDVAREIIIYHVIQGYKFKEIAKITNSPIGTVLWRYNRAMKKLKEKAGKIYD